MAISQRALQLKREKKKKKRQLKAIQPTRPTLTLAGISNWPIYESWVTTTLFEKGMGQVIVARRNSQGVMAVGSYLIDSYCLGVKDCFVRLMDLYGYHDLLNDIRHISGEIELVDAAYANTLIRQAIHYAQQLGFQPHEDFIVAQKILKNIPIDEEQTFTFGKEGRPFYIQGPYESQAQIHKITNLLALHADNIIEHKPL